MGLINFRSLEGAVLEGVLHAGFPNEHPPLRLQKGSVHFKN